MDSAGAGPWYAVGALACLAFLVLDATVALLVVLVSTIVVHCATRRGSPPRRRSRSARAAQVAPEKRMVRNPRASTAAPPSSPPPAAPSPSASPPPSEQLTFPRVPALLPVRFESDDTSAKPVTPLLDGALEQQYRQRAREPDWRARAVHMRRVQESMADEITSRDPAIRPIDGKFGCKPSLGVL